LIFAIAIGLWPLAGCAPDCETTCRKVLSCDIDSPREAIDMCKTSCETETHLYDVWGDDDKQKAFRDERSCLKQSTCDEIAAGKCYDEDMYAF